MIIYIQWQILKIALLLLLTIQEIVVSVSNAGAVIIILKEFFACTGTSLCTFPINLVWSYHPHHFIYGYYWFLCPCHKHWKVFLCFFLLHPLPFSQFLLLNIFFTRIFPPILCLFPFCFRLSVTNLLPNSQHFSMKVPRQSIKYSFERKFTAA